MRLIGTVAVAFGAACTTSESVVTAPGVSVNPKFQFTGDASPTPNKVLLCKLRGSGDYPVKAVFTVSASTGTVLHPTIELEENYCEFVWEGETDEFATVTITEQVPAGQAFLFGYVLSYLEAQGVTNWDYFSTPTRSFVVDPAVGASVKFYNKNDTPPSPVGQGCTPGFWKQRQHFDSWTAPYAPSSRFSDVFQSSAFGNQTLLQVISRGGGGLTALGRHSVAALLNAASPGVSYAYTVRQVIDAFNSAHGAGDVEAQKDAFETQNELGCPLN